MKWMEQCNEYPTCTADLPPLPAHVIDVGDELNAYNMNLIEMEDGNGR
jgi:hypothetical protein